MEDSEPLLSSRRRKTPRPVIWGVQGRPGSAAADVDDDGGGALYPSDYGDSGPATSGSDYDQPEVPSARDLSRY